MIRKDKHRMADGTIKTQIRITEGYRDSKTKKAKQRTIESFGYLEDQKDPVKFLEEIKKKDEEYKKGKNININVVKTKPFYEDEASDTTNFGYRYLEAIYDFLKLDTLFNEINYKGKSSLNEMFKYLVIQRILHPDSKRATYQLSKNFYMKNYDFSLYELYRSLDLFADNEAKIQQHLNEIIKKKIGRNLDECFYDTTNYFFQKDFEDEDEYEEVIPLITDKKTIKKQKIIEVKDENDKIHQFRTISGLLKRGVSKEHVVDPIFQFGLFMDSNGLPISSKIFPGNTSDSETLIPILKEVKANYGLPRIVVVADKGINTKENIDAVCNNGDGYMFSQILKGTKGKKYQDKLFDESLYTVVDDDYKYQIFEEEYDGLDKDGKKVKRKRKVLIYWNGKSARRERKRREEKLKKAEKALLNNAYLYKHGYDKYLSNNAYVSSTGECADKVKTSVNYTKAADDAKYDGYFAIVTSELQYDEKKIREVYHGLWKIEESFRITKSDIIAKPLFVRTEKHIKGHIMICFVALLMLRILQYKMNYSLSVERIVRAINMCSCSELTKGTICVLKKDVFEKFAKKANQKGEEYFTLKLQDTEKETVEDYKKLIEYYETKECVTLMNKSVFDNFIKTIKLK